MSSYGRIMELIEKLKAESEKLNGALDTERADKILLLSECITAALHAYQYKIYFSRIGGKVNYKPVKPLPPFYA